MKKYGIPKMYVFIPIILFFVTFLTYFNILPNGLFFDDEELIYKNSYVQNLQEFPKYFTENMVSGAGKVSNMYRPLLLLSFGFDYALWGGNPAGFHLTSILLHATNSILMFILIMQFFNNLPAAIAVSLLFIVHPVNSEAIAYASGRTDPLYSMFGLAAIITFTSYVRNRNWLYFIFSIFLYLFALLSKETSIVLPMFFLIPALIFTKRKKFSEILKLMIVPGAISLTYIFLRLTVLNFSNTLNFYPTQNEYSSSLLVRVLTFSGVFFEYMKVILFPKNLIVARNISYITDPANPSVVIFTALFGSWLLAGVALRRKFFFIIFSFLLFFVFLLPVSGIIPINNIITEHYLYLPSAGIFLLMVFPALLIMQKLPYAGKYLLLLFFLIILSALFTRTFQRTYEWRDAITFYSASLKQSPWHIPMRHNLAMAYSEKGMLDTAEKEYKFLIENGDYYPQTHHNLANIYLAQEKYKDAEDEFIKALTMDPRFLFSYYSLIDLYRTTGEDDKLHDLMQKYGQLKK